MSDLIKTLMGRMGMTMPEAGPAPTDDQRQLYEQMAQREWDQKRKDHPLLAAGGDLLHGATLADPNMPQPEFDKVSPFGKAGMLMGAMVIPPSARRLQSLKVLEDVRTLPSFTGWKPEQVSILTQLQSKFPNVFAHVERFSPIDRTKKLANGARERAYGTTQASNKLGKSIIELGTERTGDDFANTAAHELTHAAQRIRDPRGFQKKYDQAEGIFGYKKNPYEQRANKAAENYVERKNKVK